jgi:D-alanyl-D-alanine endopeptidase (penicillin-binding protein 7)
VSWIVYDLANHQITQGQNYDIVRPIASTTKLMTAMVSLDAIESLDRVIRVSNGRKQPDTVYTKSQLLHALLIKSDNNAAELLAKNYAGGRDAFLAAMNQKAHSLGLMYTHYDDPSGLIATNLSTARELARIVEAAGKYKVIRDISTKREAALEVKYGGKSRKLIIHNTNNLLVEFDNIVVSKTGYTSRAGRCLALEVTRGVSTYTVVVLGLPDVQKRNRLVREVIYNYVVENETPVPEDIDVTTFVQ